MSNFGLYKALDELGIGYAKTAVGDKYVYEYMLQHAAASAGNSPATSSSPNTPPPATASSPALK